MLSLLALSAGDFETYLNSIRGLNFLPSVSVFASFSKHLLPSSTNLDDDYYANSRSFKTSKHFGQSNTISHLTC